MKEDEHEEAWRKRYEAGDKDALPFCLDHCMDYNLPTPEWAAKAFGEACRKVRAREVKSWDDVFGRPLKRGQRLETERRNRKIWIPLLREIVKRRRAGAAINKELFNEVGALAQFGISGTVASDLYYSIPEDIRDFEEMIMDAETEETAGRI